MQTMNISLPQSMKNFVESEVAAGGYGTASEFIRDLLREAQRRKAQAKVDALLLEGLQSEASEMTRADWSALKRRVRARARKAAK
jgi:antitoxin ParD1/3/4